MTTFLVVAALMAAIAATVVAFPLLRNPKSRLIGVLVPVLIGGSAAALYAAWSNWDWHAPAPASAPKTVANPEIDAMVAKLVQHLKEQPQDQTGWIMLGRSYSVLNRPNEALNAYQHAYDIGKSADAATGLGEAMALRAGGEITPAAGRLFEEALSLEPANPKALFYGGLAAAIRGDRQLARQRWTALKNLHPPPQIEQMLDARIAELGLGEASGTNASSEGTNPPTGPSAGAVVVVNITLAPALKGRLTSEAPMFVFAREPGVQGPPLAVKRLSTQAIGTQVSLSSKDSMIGGRELKNGQKLSITARVSFSGTPMPSAGDLYGEASWQVGSDGVLNLVIDRVAQ